MYFYEILHQLLPYDILSFTRSTLTIRFSTFILRAVTLSVPSKARSKEERFFSIRCITGSSSSLPVSSFGTFKSINIFFKI